MLNLLSVLIRAIASTLWVAFKAVCLVLPAFLVFVVLTQPTIMLNRGVPIVQDVDARKVHEIFPTSRWGDFKACGEYFDEQEEFDEARSCVNEKVWPESPLSEDLTIPRCFIVSAQSPDIFSSKDKVFNFVPIISLFGIGAVVGVYQPETKTVFVVENNDAAMVYRHELQHFFLHEHDPETGGGGHFQPIWEKCEPPYYTPSFKAKMIGAAKELEENHNEEKDDQ